MQEQDKQLSPRDTPVFGAHATTKVARWRGALLAVAVLGAAVFAAVYLSREKAPAADGMAGMAGMSGSPGVAKAEAVMLSEEQARRIGVTFAVVERGALRPEVRTVAQVTFDETKVRTVTLKFDGWIDHLYVDYTGRSVRAGEPLVSTYSPMLVSAAQELVLAGKLVRDVANADSTTRANALELRSSARQRLLNWDVPIAEIDRVERTGEVQKSLVVSAPYSGVVVEKMVLAGQRVMAGDPLFRIADLSVVWVEGEVFERDLPLVRLGELVEVELQALAGRPRNGRIVFLQPTVSTETRTVRVRVALANADGELKPGMYATVRIRGGDNTPVLHVPRSAVLSTGKRDIVFVRRDDGMLEPRDVIRGISTDERVVIQRGLVVGETVVASATFLVDAESNLGSMLGGMGGMPGMDVSPPARDGKKPTGVAPPPLTPKQKASPPNSDMPGMVMPTPVVKPKKAPPMPAVLHDNR